MLISQQFVNISVCVSVSVLALIRLDSSTLHTSTELHTGQYAYLRDTCAEKPIRGSWYTLPNSGPIEVHPKHTFSWADSRRYLHRCNHVSVEYQGIHSDLILPLMQVLNASLDDGMEAVLEDLGGPVTSILANNSVLSRGLVIRSSSNQISVRFSSEWPARPGLLLLRYRGNISLLWNLPHFYANSVKGDL